MAIKHIPSGPGGVVIGTDPFGHQLPPVFEPPPTFPPLDPGELAQIRMLDEAVLNSFAADSPTARPLVPNALRWDITLPTTAIPGVFVDVRLAELVEGSANPGFLDNEPPVGMVSAAIRRATTYTLSLVAPLATRVLGTVTISVDLAGSTSFVLPTAVVTGQLKNQISAGFSGGGGLSLRTPPTVAVHLDAVTVDVAASFDGPLYVNPDVDIALSWTLSGQGPAAWNAPATADADIVCAISAASTNVDVGFGETVGSLGTANLAGAVATGVSDAYLHNLVGPLVAQLLALSLTDLMNSRRPTGLMFHHLEVVPDAITFWYCPKP